MASVPERGDIDERYTWDLASIYADESDWEDDFADARDAIDSLTEYEGTATDDAETLLEVLELYEEVGRTVSMLGAYAKMRSDEDTTDQHYQALLARVQSLGADASAASSFIEPEIQSLERDEVDAFFEDEPALETYDHYLDDVLRVKPHTRSAEVESVIADLSDVTGAASEVYSMLTNADLEFPSVERDGEEVPVTLNNVTLHLKDPDRAFRERVHTSFYDHWASYRNAVGASYKNSVKADVKLARLRNYDTAREASMDGPNVPVAVYDTLVDTVRDRLDVLHRHVDLKRTALGVDDLEMWDVYMPMTDTESPDVEYDDAVDHVIAALEPLGEEYVSRVEAGIENRWIDVYETRAKQSGAYSGGTYDTHPFILMNWQSEIQSMFTLAHELGHSLHSEYTSERQPYIYSGYTTFVAEVASTVNESLLTHHLLETVEDETFRRHVLNEYLERFRSTLFRQTLFAEFELETHRLVEDGDALTPDVCDDIYRDLKEAYYEPAVVDERIAREWMRIPHFYRAFYVYQYATGIAAAVALSSDIVNEGAPAAERYLEFLSRGSSAYPLELLADAGVDMATPRPVAAAIDVYDEYLDEMAALLE